MKIINFDLPSISSYYISPKALELIHKELDKPIEVMERDGYLVLDVNNIPQVLTPLELLCSKNKTINIQGRVYNEFVFDTMLASDGNRFTVTDKLGAKFNYVLENVKAISNLKIRLLFKRVK